MRLRDIMASVIGVVAGAVDGFGLHRAAAWLRAKADELTDRAVDAIAPETVHAHRALANAPEGVDTSDDSTARPRRDFGPDV